jgi:hypothetical protein
MLWGWQPALRHFALVWLILLLVVEYMLLGFPKIPFTCSFLPGKANLSARLSWYCVAFLLCAWLVSVVEIRLVWSPAGYWIGVGALAPAVAWHAWKRIRRERELPGFIYEERPDWLVTRLDLQA